MGKSIVTILICFFCCEINGFAQQFDNNCNLDGTNYVFVDSLMSENNLINYNKAIEYMYNKDNPKSYILITNDNDYNLFKEADAKDIDFEKYNLFIAFFGNYGGCYSSKIPIKFFLLFDKLNRQNIISITQIIHVPYLKMACPAYFITLIVPKNSDKVCYTKKIIENEN
ncbi:MAG TPA: hypothetical protein PKX15_09100 [Bacteroidales bacterium]|nr:hypothetical protein [Bacteroidales bacterium]